MRIIYSMFLQYITSYQRIVIISIAYFRIYSKKCMIYWSYIKMEKLFIRHDKGKRKANGCNVSVLPVEWNAYSIFLLLIIGMVAFTWNKLHCQKWIWPLGTHFNEIFIKIQKFSLWVCKCCLQNVEHFTKGTYCWDWKKMVTFLQTASPITFLSSKRCCVLIQISSNFVSSGSINIDISNGWALYRQQTITWTANVPLDPFY